LRVCESPSRKPGIQASGRWKPAMLKGSPAESCGAHQLDGFRRHLPARSPRPACGKTVGFNRCAKQTIWTVASGSRWQQGRMAFPPTPAQLLEPAHRLPCSGILRGRRPCPPAAQILDRRCEDLLDQDPGHGLLWVGTPHVTQAVAGVRRSPPAWSGPHELEVTLHPGWSHLAGRRPCSHAGPGGSRGPISCAAAQ